MCEILQFHGVLTVLGTHTRVIAQTPHTTLHYIYTKRNTQVCRLRRGADRLRQHLGERGPGMLRVRSLPGGAPLPGFPHEERQHGLLGRGRGG